MQPKKQSLVVEVARSTLSNFDPILAIVALIDCGSESLKERVITCWESKSLKPIEHDYLNLLLETHLNQLRPNYSGEGFYLIKWKHQRVLVTHYPVNERLRDLGSSEIYEVLTEIFYEEIELGVGNSSNLMELGRKRNTEVLLKQVRKEVIAQLNSEEIAR
ncbi:hypothetical protein [Myxosarcina sp. GI1(2024)]